MLLETKTKKYKILAERLYQKCQEVQMQNERCVHRINFIKKLLSRRQREVNLLKARLDRHNDPWRTLPMVAPHPKRKIEQKRGPKPKVKPPEETAKVKKVRKQRMKKVPIDVNNEIRGQLPDPPALPVTLLQTMQQQPQQQQQQQQHHIQSAYLGNQF